MTKQETLVFCVRQRPSKRKKESRWKKQPLLKDKRYAEFLALDEHKFFHNGGVFACPLQHVSQKRDGNRDLLFFFEKIQHGIKKNSASEEIVPRCPRLIPWRWQWLRMRLVKTALCQVPQKLLGWMDLREQVELPYACQHGHSWDNKRVVLASRPLIHGPWVFGSGIKGKVWRCPRGQNCSSAKNCEQHQCATKWQSQ